MRKFVPGYIGGADRVPAVVQVDRQIPKTVARAAEAAQIDRRAVRLPESRMDRMQRQLERRIEVRAGAGRADHLASVVDRIGHGIGISGIDRKLLDATPRPSDRLELQLLRAVRVWFRVLHLSGRD